MIYVIYNGIYRKILYNFDFKNVSDCAEDCNEHSECKNGTCVCLDPGTCSYKYDAVCGYDSESDKYKTFSTKCELMRSFCKEKQFHFKYNGECSKGKVDNMHIFWNYIEVCCKL